LYCTFKGNRDFGRIVIEFEIDLSSRYSEKNNCTSSEIKFTVPVSGIECNKTGGVSSLGPPDGD